MGKHPACDSIRKNGSEMGHVVDEFANMSEVPNVPFAIRVIDLRSMIHVENRNCS